MKMKFIAAGASLLAFAGCTVDAPRYSDPLSGMSAASASSARRDALGNLAQPVGVVVSSNTEQMLQMLTSNQKVLESVPIQNVAAKEEQSQSYLVDRVTAVIKRRYPSAILVNNPAEAAQRAARARSFSISPASLAKGAATTRPFRSA